MNPAIQRMMERYHVNTVDESVNALREILQQLALLGLWRSRFFEQGAFYGGSALRILHGLDRYSEDLDFSLMEKDTEFVLGRYGDALQRELASFGFEVSFEARTRNQRTSIESPFLKTNTLEQLIVVEAEEEIIEGIHPGRLLRIKLEVDIDPPGGFETETATILQPIPFAARVYSLPDLFAGKMHALLCRKWKNRVKGRDWYDFVWYVANHPRLRISHLEERMRQSGDYASSSPLTVEMLRQMLHDAIETLDVAKASQEVEPFLRDSSSLRLWSRPFFNDLVDRIEVVQ